MSLIFKRKSVRKFRDEKVSDEKIENNITENSEIKLEENIN